MSFSARFKEHLAFKRKVDSWIEKFFDHLKNDSENTHDIPNLAYVSKYYFDGDEVGIDWEETWAYGGYDTGYVYAPMSEFMEFAEHQWELDQFDKKLEGGTTDE